MPLLLLPDRAALVCCSTRLRALANWRNLVDAVMQLKAQRGERCPVCVRDAMAALPHALVHRYVKFDGVSGCPVFEWKMKGESRRRGGSALSVLSGT